MDIAEYRKFIQGLINPSVVAMGRDQLLVYLSSKLLNESGELLEIIDSYENTPIIDESGDVSWYLFNMYNVFETDPVYIETFHRSHIPENQLIIEAAKLAGMILKKTYHGKNVSDDEIIKQLHIVYTSFMIFLEEISYDLEYDFSLEKVNQANYNKLSKRHGTSYNAGFYQSTT